MDDYEMNQKKNVERNKKFLEEFKEYLILNKLSDKTIRNHLSNVELYINDYLNYYGVSKMEDGCHEIGMFLGDWFIRKCMWSTATSIKSTASSIKKFYKCMNELNYVSKEDYKYLCDTIKKHINDWIDEVNEYNNF